MKIALIALLVAIVLAFIAYISLFPSNTFISFSRPGGGALTFSRTGVSVQRPPDHYATDGFSHVDPYISHLLVPTSRFKFLHIFTSDGNRGFGLHARDGVVEASLTVEWQQDPQREATIRSFFSSLGIVPSRDYLASNGGVPDATRILDYPLSGSAVEVTALTKRILQELCSVSPTEALDMKYTDK